MHPAGTVVLSRGTEEHASFAWHGAWQAQRAVGRLRRLLGLEWVTAERALRMKNLRTPPGLAPARSLAAHFGAPGEDRVLGPDVDRAEAALPRLAAAVRDALAA